jgi:hypothetical protein
MFRAQADGTLILQSASYCEGGASVAKKNAAVRREVLAHIVYLFL